MKFMVSWEVHDDKRHDVLQAFSQMTAADEKAEMGNKIKLIGRWHDLASFTGVAICESDDAQAVMAWALSWNHALDLQVVPVLDDEETRKVGRAKLG